MLFEGMLILFTNKNQNLSLYHEVQQPDFRSPSAHYRNFRLISGLDKFA